MGLLVDNRKQTQGRPAIHVIAIGVSAYDHMATLQKEKGLEWFNSVDGPAAAAWNLARLFTDSENHNCEFSVPVATVRVLLSPTPRDSDAIPTMGQWLEVETINDKRATLESVRAGLRGWRADASGNRDSLAVFYFAGHGFGSEASARLLLQDFTFGPDVVKGKHTCLLDDVGLGMRPCMEHRPNLARNLWLIADCCQTPEIPQLANARCPELILTDPAKPATGADALRNVLKILAAPPRMPAWTIPQPGAGTVLSRAIINAMSWGADLSAEVSPNGRRWEVTWETIRKALVHDFQRVAQEVLPAILKRHSSFNPRNLQISVSQPEAAYAPDGSFPESRLVATLREAPLARLKVLHRTRDQMLMATPVEVKTAAGDMVSELRLPYVPASEYQVAPGGASIQFEYQDSSAYTNTSPADVFVRPPVMDVWPPKPTKGAR